MPNKERVGFTCLALNCWFWPTSLMEMIKNPFKQHKLWLKIMGEHYCNCFALVTEIDMTVSQRAAFRHYSPVMSMTIVLCLIKMNACVYHSLHLVPDWQRALPGNNFSYGFAVSIAKSRYKCTLPAPVEVEGLKHYHSWQGSLRWEL